MQLGKNSLNTVKNRVQSIISNQGLDLVEFKIFPQGRTWVIRSLVDYSSGGVTLGECSLLNHKISDLINEDNILGDDFIVEVNSPGLDRFLKEPKDFLRIKGKIVQLWLKESFNNKKYLEAEVVEARDGVLFVKIEDGIIKISFDIINKARGKEK